MPTCEWLVLFFMQQLGLPHMTTPSVYPPDFHPTHPVCGNTSYCLSCISPEQVPALYHTAPTADEKAKCAFVVLSTFNFIIS